MATVEHQPVEKCLHRVPISYMLWRTDSQSGCSTVVDPSIYAEHSPQETTLFRDIKFNYNTFYTCTYVYNRSISPMIKDQRLQCKHFSTG